MEKDLEGVLQLKKTRYDMAMLRRRLAELKRRAGVLQSEALHHQVKLIDDLDQRLLGPSTLLNLNLQDTYLDLMKKKLEVQQKVTVSGLSEEKVGVKRVVGFLDDPEPLEPPKHRKQQQQEETEDDTRPEQGVFKLYEAEGTIGDTAYATAFVVKSAVGQKGGKVSELEGLRLGTPSTVAKKMLTQGRVSMPETVCCFTVDLYYHKVLRDERAEALRYLEEDVPGVEVMGGTEPVVLQLLSHGQHQVEVVWELTWDNPNSRFKYDIVVNCSDEVVARYSTADIYPFLSKQKKLLTPEDVTSFAEAFTDL